MEASRLHPRTYEPSSASSSPSQSQQNPRRVFSNAGFHQVAAPNLSRPGATSPAPLPHVVRYQAPEATNNGFKPILGPRIPIQRRRQPESLDYGSDIITIYDVKPNNNNNFKVNNDSLIRTVSSSFQVRREDNENEKKKGRVFDDVIYDLPSEENNSDFKSQETTIILKPDQPSKPNNRLNGWRKIS